ncbi:MULTISPECIES: chorismate mutase [Edwardsiella]|uniref:Chorismate mutase n=2 Tax=Edwardsiella anguillarum TaxID=1821960 RepID=A0A076LI57_9GAMM|nr:MULTISPECIES: chorismate mutase [Edwardsiella]AKM46817.1 chorismate mutase [Edwardsiella sp. EA181011]GAJ68596.1 periplasmic chorismate mutase I [Edwardsiella piscicida]AIJ07726.1 Periplasmic chorismate mutase I precursor [Edwardsiella anguillarum ET080813]AKR78877.1 chorismate mutase [Edwardsiella sp. LADL05-105]KAB0590215.1 chorismate mutase [Edwardsiella anguillarum]
MGRKITGKLLILAWLFSSTTGLARSIPSEDIASLINQRLSYMKDVAGYKANHHLAIEDLPQEAKVLANAMREAATLGLDGESVKPFIQAQMDTAKAIQYRYRADWLSMPEKGWQPESLEQVRAKISMLNTTILTDIRTQLTAGDPLTDKAAFMKRLNQTNLRDSDKEHLWYSLKKITLKKYPDPVNHTV